MTRHLNAPLIAVLLLGSPGLWSANHLVARWAADAVAPHALTLGRWLIASILFIAVFGRSLWRSRVAIRAELPEFFLLAVLGIWISGASVYYGAQTTSATNIGLIYSLAPVFIALLAALVYREHVGAAQIGGIVLALLGVLIIVIKAELGAVQQIEWTRGDLWIVLAALAWALYSVRLRYRPTALEGNTRLSCVILCGVVLMTPLALIEAQWVGPPELSRKALNAVLILGVVAGFGAYLTYSWLLAGVGPTRTAVVLYLVPPYNALLGWLLLGEPVHGYHLGGGALVLCGVYLVNRLAPKAL